MRERDRRGVRIARTGRIARIRSTASLLAFLPLAWTACAGPASAPSEPPDEVEPAAEASVRPAPLDPATLDLEAMLQETRVLHTDAGRVRLVWWIPVEYWEATFAREGSRVEPEQARTILETLRPFAVFGVVDAQVDAEGALSSVPAETLRRGLTLSTPSGTQAPLEESEIPTDVASLLAGMQPAIARSVGDVGRNMVLFVFENRSEAGEAIVSPRQEGFLELGVGEQGFRWTLPLGSFLPPKVCPIDQEPMSAAWTYCPRHGARLE